MVNDIGNYGDYKGTFQADNVSYKAASIPPDNDADVETPPQNLEDLLKNNPQLQDILNKIQTITNSPSTTSEDRFSLQSITQLLIELGQVLQSLATSYAGSLTNTTNKMNAYAQKMTQIPVLLNSQDSDATNRNQVFGNMLQAVTANKGIEEDQAKKIQSMLQQLQDQGTNTNDFITTFIKLWADMGRSITGR